MRAGRALAIVMSLVAAMPAAEAAQREPRQAPSSHRQAHPILHRQAHHRPAATPARMVRAIPAIGVGAGTPILPVAGSSGLSCVPFVRQATGMGVSGDARLWWRNAAELYHRGQRPERGAVLAFMASGGMSRGHVAVVSHVLDDRTVLIDHSNWAGPGIRRGTVMRGVRVIDVSDRNDWTAVRVQVGHDRSAFGRTYPTYGFIYNRPLGTPVLTAAMPAAATVEVAQAPASTLPTSAHAELHLRLAAEALAQ